MATIYSSWDVENATFNMIWPDALLLYSLQNFMPCNTTIPCSRARLCSDLNANQKLDIQVWSLLQASIVGILSLTLFPFTSVQKRINAPQKNIYEFFLTTNVAS